MPTFTNSIPTDTSSGEPFSPGDVFAVHKKNKGFIPVEMFEAVNELLTEKASGSIYITIHQKEIIERFKQKIEEAEKICDIKEAFKKHWFDFEPYYEDAGWEVQYESPGYCETGPTYYRFCCRDGFSTKSSWL